MSGQTNTGASSNTRDDSTTLDDENLILDDAEPTEPIELGEEDHPNQDAEPTATATSSPTTIPKQASVSEDEAEQSVDGQRDDEREKEPPASPQAVPSDKPIGSSGAGAWTKPATSVTANTVESRNDPATMIEEPHAVAIFADARKLAAATTAERASAPSLPASEAQHVTVRSQNMLEAATRLVTGVVNWVLGPLAGNNPDQPAQPPLMWALLAFARREFDRAFSAFGIRSAADTMLTNAQTTSSFALTDTPSALIANPRPTFPVPGQQLSPSTGFVDWVTGNYGPNFTYDRFGIWGTDVGTMWDNGMVDDPATPWNENQVLIAVGDTFAGPDMSGIWRLNTLLRSGDSDLADGMLIPDGEWFNGNMFGGAPLSNPTFARQIIHPPAGLPGGVTLIPTAGISVPTPGTTFGVTQYMSFMSVSQWGTPGRWTTNYSAIAYSTDNGENWALAPTTVRSNSPWSGHQNFQQSAFVRPGDGYVYIYGTPNGREGYAYLSRVAEHDILDLTRYEYYSAGKPGWLFGWGATPAGWYRNDPGAATPVFGQDTGACGVANPGNRVSEMSVQYNNQLNKYVVLYGDQFNNIVMRTADSPQGAWSSAKVLIAQQPGGIYAPMMHPWSPSTKGTGTDLYWNLSLWSEYNIMLMKTDLTKV